MSALLGFSFLHPGILGGLALAGLPILIHILNRRRFKSMEWAAMDFLLDALGEVAAEVFARSRTS